MLFQDVHLKYLTYGVCVYSTHLGVEDLNVLPQCPLREEVDELGGLMSGPDEAGRSLRPPHRRQVAHQGGHGRPPLSVPSHLAFINIKE